MEPKHKLEIKGYKLSTDYRRLWELVQSGHRVPAWLVYTDEYEKPIWDIVEVKLAWKSKDYDIGIRGISYSSFEKTMEGFEKNCKFYSLHYIDAIKN